MRGGDLESREIGFSRGDDGCEGFEGKGGCVNHYALENQEPYGKGCYFAVKSTDTNWNKVFETPIQQDGEHVVQELDVYDSTGMKKLKTVKVAVMKRQCLMEKP